MPKPDYRIRRALLTDRSQLGRLWTAVLKEQCEADGRLGISEDALERWYNDYPLWIKDDSKRIFVADAGGEAIGFLTAHRWAPPPIYAESSEVYIDELYIAADHRGKGMGRKLVDEAKAWAEVVGAKRLRMSALVENRDAVDFWKEQGAEPFSVTLTIELKGEETGAKSGVRKLGF